MSGNTSLTQMQLLGVASDTNVAEGYPRFAPTPSQAAIFARLAELMDEARRTPYPVLEVRAHTAFFHALGQRVGADRQRPDHQLLLLDGRDRRRRGGARPAGEGVGLVHPVIDCIPALLRARGLSWSRCRSASLRAATRSRRIPRSRRS